MYVFLSYSSHYFFAVVRALRYAIEGCGHDFEPFITVDLLQLIFKTLEHTNRFVREIGYNVISSIVKCPNVSEATVNTHWATIAENLAGGLADNWSQVHNAT